MNDLIEQIMQTLQSQVITTVLKCNEKTERFGLSLTEEEAKALVSIRNTALKESRRVELGKSILPEIIDAFCDSAYIDQNNYVETIGELQEIFFLYKNESMDGMTDDELLTFMREQFEQVCYGDLEYLASTCLERFSRAIRSGYQSQAVKGERDEYRMTNNENEYQKFSEETRWEYELYRVRLEDLE